MTEAEALEYEANARMNPYLMPGTVVHGFYIQSVLGYGGFGVTYEAVDMGLQRRVVIKENFPQASAYRDARTKVILPLNDDERPYFEWAHQNFIREARTLASLDHENIIKILSIFEDLGTAYFVMPYVEGYSLGHLVQRREKKGLLFSQSEVLGVLTRMLRALRHVHELGIFHRDIKPDNVLVSKSGIPILIDFGSARVYDGSTPKTIILTSGFSPPEQAFERACHGPWSDLYSLGALVHKMVTGKAPELSSDRLKNDREQKLAHRIELRGIYAPEFLETVDKALMPKIEDRYMSAQEWLRDLHPFLPSR